MYLIIFFQKVYSDISDDPISEGTAEEPEDENGGFSWDGPEPWYNTPGAVLFPKKKLFSNSYQVRVYAFL